MKKFLGWSIIVLLFAAGLFFYYQIFLRSNRSLELDTPGPMTVQQSKPVQISGKITSIISQPHLISLESTPSNINILLVSQTKILSGSNQQVEYNSLQKGFTVKISGNKLPNNSIIAETINIIDAPALLIYKPAQNTSISDSILLEGIATRSASFLYYRLINDRNKAVYLDDKIAISKENKLSYSQFQTTLGLPQKISTIKNNDSLTLEIDFQPIKKGSAPHIINLTYQK